MTKIYIYCLFDTMDSFIGVYSSLKTVHRDALKLSNRGSTGVYLFYDDMICFQSTKLIFKTLMSMILTLIRKRKLRQHRM